MNAECRLEIEDSRTGTEIRITIRGREMYASRLSILPSSLCTLHSAIAASSIAVLSVLGACAPGGPHREVLAPSPSPMPVFSPAVRTGDLVFLSGQIGTRPGTAELVSGGVGPETRQTLENIQRLLDGIGLGMHDVVKCTVFLADINEYSQMNAVYREFFPRDPPARSTVAGSGLALGARVEIDCIAAAR